MLPEKLLGQRLGSYQIEAILGRGGMAVVYRARQTDGETVALKVLFPPPDAAAEIRLRFEREARTAARLRHPAIVRVLDAGQAEGYAYLAMTFIEGETLADHLRGTASLNEALALDIAWQIADALDYAHRQGVVHRDVKPSNILLTGDGRAWLTDFGVAQALDDPALTRTGHAIGTPAYMAPEQARGDQPIDGRADLYALGVVLYHMLTGRPPFQGTTPHILHAHLYDPPPPPSATVRISPGLEAVIMQALAKDVSQRFQTGAAMAQALADVSDQTGVYHDLAAPARLKSKTAWSKRWLWLVPVMLIAALAVWQFIRPGPASPIALVNPSLSATATQTMPATPAPPLNSGRSPTSTPSPTLTATASPTPAPLPTFTVTPEPTPTPSATPVPPPTITPTTPPTDTPPPSPTSCPVSSAPEFSALLEDQELGEQLGCPRAEASSTSAAWQPFERGGMLWRADENFIYTLEPENRWRPFADRWREGDPAFDPNLSAPEGLHQPVRGFGLVWREKAEVRDLLGWATAEEQGFTAVIQEFAAGFAWQDPDRNRILVLFNDGTYRVAEE